MAFNDAMIALSPSLSPMTPETRRGDGAEMRQLTRGGLARCNQHSPQRLRLKHIQFMIYLLPSKASEMGLRPSRRLASAGLPRYFHLSELSSPKEEMVITGLSTVINIIGDKMGSLTLT